jgi:hypothetical protein
MQQDKLTYHFNEFISEFKSQITEEVATSVIDSLKEVIKSLPQGRPTDDMQHVTLSELACLFSISKSKINQLRKKHKDFPLVKIGTSVRFNPREVKVFLDKL